MVLTDSGLKTSELDVECTRAFLIDSGVLKIEFDESALDYVWLLEKLESAVLLSGVLSVG